MPKTGRTLTARRSFIYAGKRVNQGDQFFARGADARLLMAVGRASSVATPQQAAQRAPRAPRLPKAPKAEKPNASPRAARPLSVKKPVEPPPPVPAPEPVVQPEAPASEPAPPLSEPAT